MASTESWSTIRRRLPTGAAARATAPPVRLLRWIAPTAGRDSVDAELVLAADQFIITPAARTDERERDSRGG